MSGFFKKIITDRREFDWDNHSEARVLASHYFSAYKRRLVIRTCFKRSGSLGVLFISRRANKRKDGEDEVRHEYGHTKQLSYLGFFKYIFCIGIPSLLQWGKEQYYSKPWEITADLYGGVRTRIHEEAALKKGQSYLEESLAGGISVWKGHR